VVLIAQDCIISFGSMDLGLYRVRIGSDYLFNIFVDKLFLCSCYSLAELTVLDRPAFATTIGIHNYILGINTRRKSKTTPPICLSALLVECISSKMTRGWLFKTFHSCMAMRFEGAILK
jgi:hypothetical protein